jgi:DDE domain
MPSEVVTDAAAVYPGVLDELIPSAWHHVDQYANNPIEADHSQLKHRLPPMRGLRTDPCVLGSSGTGRHRSAPFGIVGCHSRCMATENVTKRRRGILAEHEQ